MATTGRAQTLVPCDGIIFDRVEADGQNAIGGGEQPVGRLIAEEADPPRILRRPGGRRPAARALERRRIGQPARREKAADRLGAAMFRGLHAEYRHGPARRVDQLRRALQFTRSRLSLRRAASPAGADVAGKGAEPHVLGQSEENRAGPAALGRAHGVAEDLGQHMGVQRLGGEFGDGAHDVDAVQRLMRVLEAVARLDLAADRKHRVAFRGGRREAGHEIGDAGPGSDETDADAAGHAAHGRGHEGGVLLVPADHELDLRVRAAR